MLKRLISIFLILTMSVLLFSSCGDDEGVTLLIPVKEDPMCLDPQTVDNETAQMIIANCFEGLVRIDDNNKIIPGVAEKWNISSDGKTYTFYLRNKTKWHVLNSHKDVLGDENYLKKYDSTVKAKDFVFGLQRAVLSQTDAENVDKIFCIKNAKNIYDGKTDKQNLGVIAKDDFTLQISLDRANDDFLRILTLPICMPCNEEFFNKSHAKYGMEVKYTFCNGPFFISKWTDDNAVSVIKNDDYIGENKVNPSGVYFYVNTDDESIVKKLKQNSYDCAKLNNNMISLLADNKKINKQECNNSITGLAFNCSEPTVSDINIRKALLSAIDSQTLDITATGIIPECVRFGEKAYRDVAGRVQYPVYDEAQASKLFNQGLEALGVENAEITILCNEKYSESMKKMIQNWQKAFGTKIVARVEIKTDEEISKAVKDKNYQIAVQSIESDNSFCTDILNNFVSLNEKNIYSFSDNSYDSLIDSIINKASGAQIIQQCKTAENMLVQNGVFYPLYKNYEYLALNKNISGLVIEPSFAYIDFTKGDVN